MKFEKITERENSDRFYTRTNETESKTEITKRKNLKQRYYKYNNDGYVAVDNRTGEFFVERFKTAKKAKERLLNY